MAFKSYKDWPDNLMLDEYLQVGDTVDKEMFEHFLDVLPPKYYSFGLLNAGGAIDTIENEKGEYENTYITFIDSDEGYVFKGECFAGENINRNPKLEPTQPLYTVYEEERLTSSELRDYYRRVTGLDNDAELSDVEVQCYLLETLAETPAEKEEAQHLLAVYRFEQGILARLEDSGFDVSQIQLDVQQFIDKEHQNCIWYGGPVATVEYKDHVFWLEAHGDVSVTWYSQPGFDDDLYEYFNENNSGAYSDVDARNHFIDDVHLSELDKDGRLAWQNNNWFEMFVETPDGQKYSLMDVCNSDILEEFVFEVVSSMDSILTVLYRDNDKIASVDAVLSQATQTCEEVNKGEGKSREAFTNEELIMNNE